METSENISKSKSDDQASVDYVYSQVGFKDFEPTILEGKRKRKVEDYKELEEKAYQAVKYSRKITSVKPKKNEIKETNRFQNFTYFFNFSLVSYMLISNLRICHI